MAESDEADYRERRLERQLRRAQRERRHLSQTQQQFDDVRGVPERQIDTLEAQIVQLRARIVHLEAELDRHRWGELVAIATWFTRRVGDPQEEQPT